MFEGCSLVSGTNVVRMRVWQRIPILSSDPGKGSEEKRVDEQGKAMGGGGQRKQDTERKGMIDRHSRQMTG